MWLRDWNAAWQTWRVEPERFIDADDRVVVIYRMTVEGNGSGVQLDRHEGQVWTIRAGLAWRVVAVPARKRSKAPAWAVGVAGSLRPLRPRIDSPGRAGRLPPTALPDERIVSRVRPYPV